MRHVCARKACRFAIVLIPVLYSFPFITYANIQQDDALIFSAPPRENISKGEKTYVPIADYLSKVLGRKVVYEHPGNWLSYSANIRKDRYDFLFDGPHFVSWRIAKKNHTPVVKIPGDFYFLFITQKNNNDIIKVSDLIGKKVCGHAPPNQGTLRLYDQFPNPLRQPMLITIKGWRNIFNAVQEGECVAGVVPAKILKSVDPARKLSKIIFETKHVSGQAITAGEKLSRKEVAKIRSALLSEEGRKATQALQQRFATPPLIKATKEEYKGILTILEGSYWFRE